MRTPEFEDFIASAAHYPQIWRIILGSLAALLTYIIPLMVIGVVLGFMFPNAMTMFEEVATGSSPKGVLILLGTFVFMGLAAVAAAAVHRRGLASLIGPFRPACHNFSYSVILVCVVYLATGIPISWLFLEDATPNLPFGEWISYLPLALPLLLIQTGAEELLFRGYLMQALAARFQSFLVWMILPSVLFGFAHLNFDVDPKITWMLVLATGMFGLVAADLTRVTGNLGAAIGFHFANNFFALFLVAIAGELSGLSLYHAPFTMEDVDILMPLLAFDIGVTIVTWYVLRRALAPSS